MMSEQGMAMMGSAMASGIDRARIAAEQAIACPLLEGVNLAGARGVLVNITASKPSLKLRETKEVMNTIRTFAAEDATIIYGGVYDDDARRRPARHGGRDRPRDGRRPRARPSRSSCLVTYRAEDRHGQPAPARSTTSSSTRPAVIRRNRAVDGRGAAAVRRGQVRHPGVPAQAGRLTRPGGGHLLAGGSPPLP